jgi:hypothetical protein
MIATASMLCPLPLPAPARVHNYIINNGKEVEKQSSFKVARTSVQQLVKAIEPTSC